jgi:hypothetical protein
MLTRVRTKWFAGGGSLLLVLAISGAALGADMAGEAGAPTLDDPTVVVDAAATFVDADGDGIEDSCDTAVVADPNAAAAAVAAADTDGDGTISVSEAAHSNRVAGANCNHGGYVSSVANAQCDSADAAAGSDQGATDEPTVVLAADENEDEAEDTNDQDQGAAEDTSDPCTEAAAPEAADPEADTAAPCVPVAAPPFDPTTFTGPGAFGAYVSTVAKSDAVGGKNCNHGGAVSEAVKAAKATAKAAAQAAREAAKAERKAEHEAAKAARTAAHANKSKGKSGGH